jgi:membrane associated rhomboid family serine protease
MQTSLAFPKPGPALKGLLIVVGVLGIGFALIGLSGFGLFAFTALTCAPEGVFHFQLWRLVTSGLLTSPDSYGHLIFSLLGLYFLSTDLEQRWGGGRFLAFMAGSVALGNVLAIVVDLIAPGGWGTFHVTHAMFGPEAAIAATAIAWASVNGDKQILLFFVVPVRGVYLTWVTIGFCILGVIYPGAPPAGHIAPFGGVIAGLLFGGAQSPARRFFLKTKLWWIRRRLGDAAPPTVDQIVRGATQKKRGSGPPLRVVSGGLDDKKPPKDKRYLN